MSSIYVKQQPDTPNVTLIRNHVQKLLEAFNTGNLEIYAEAIRSDYIDNLTVRNPVGFPFTYVEGKENYIKSMDQWKSLLALHHTIHNIFPSGADVVVVTFTLTLCMKLPNGKILNCSTPATNIHHFEGAKIKVTDCYWDASALFAAIGQNQ